MSSDAEDLLQQAKRIGLFPNITLERFARYKDAFEMTMHQGMTLKQAGEVLDVTPARVRQMREKYQRLLRALGKQD